MSSKKALILQSQEGDWEGLFINGELVDEGHTLNQGTHPFIYCLQIAEKTISNKNNFTSCITFYKQIPKEEYLP